MLGLAALLGSGACYTGASISPTDVPANGAAQPGSGPAIGANSGLPCDVAKVVSDSCASCHGAKPTGGATTSLVTREGFTAPSTVDPQQTVGQLSVARMRDAKDPMPKSGLLPEADVAIVDTWVKAGMPRGECATLPSASDPFFDTAVQCSSNSRWTRGDRGSQLMHPGMACVDCHKKSGEREAAIYTMAGTLYPTGHEPDDCNGTSATAGAQIVITDATGRETRLSPNSAGNFFTTARFTAPCTVKVVQGDKVRAMKAALPATADCNSCHTADGAEGAPGRIALPQ